MTRFGYHCSHEQFAPRDLLDYVRQAEQAGFDGAMSSEHIAPWSVRQGHSAFAWAWLGAAMQATDHMPFGALAIPGGWRYHPVVAAHAFATLSDLFPGRFTWIAAGSGEAVNERMIGQGWPDKATRNARLLAGVEIMRALWRGETVTRDDGFFKTEAARLWTLPAAAPRIYGAALSAETAAWLGGWADGLITVRRDPEELVPIIDAFRRNGGAGKPIVLQLQLSWHADVEQARHNVHHSWRHVAAAVERDTLASPEDFDRACAHVTPGDMDDYLLVTSDALEIANHINSYAAYGFDEIYLHNAGDNQRNFIELFKTQISPLLTRAS